MAIEHRPPTDATTKELYGNAIGCARPGCDRPLYRLVDTQAGTRTLNSRVAHICARSEGGPRWNPDMTEEENRSVSNLLVLCVEHASEIDDPLRVHSHPVELLREWKREQVDASDRAGRGLDITDDEAAEIAKVSFYGPSTFTNFVVHGGEAGKAPGAGGGGGGAAGPNARGGSGGSGGDVVEAWYRAEDLPDVLHIEVGRGGRGGTEGDGKDGEDTVITTPDGDELLRAKGGGAGRSGGAAVPTRGRVTVSAMLARYAEVIDGLLNTLGAGWSIYTLPSLPGQLVGALALTVTTDPALGGHVLNGRVALLNPASVPVLTTELQLPLPDGKVVRSAYAFPLNLPLDVAGIWALVVSIDDLEVARVDFEVLSEVQGQPAASGPDDQRGEGDPRSIADQE